MKKKLAWKNPFFIIPFCILLSISLLLMIHAGYISDIYANSFEKQLLWFIIGLVVLFVMKFFPINWLFKNSIFLYIFNLLLLILVLFIGEEINGARAWIDLHYFNIQPSEFMKISYSLYLAHLCSRKRFFSFWDEAKFLMYVLLIFLLPTILVFLEPDTGAILFYFFIVGATLCRAKPEFNEIRKGFQRFLRVNGISLSSLNGTRVRLVLRLGPLSYYVQLALSSVMHR